MDTAARLVRQARAAAGLTQAQLARRAGTSQPAVAAYESGAKTPTVATLDRLLGAAGQSLTASTPQVQPPGVRLRRSLAEQRERILEVAAEHRASNVRVFGSVARGEEDSGSDIDLLVDMEPGASLLDQVRLRRSLIEVLGVEVDVVTSGGLQPRDFPLLEEAIPL